MLETLLRYLPTPKGIRAMYRRGERFGLMFGMALAIAVGVAAGALFGWTFGSAVAVIGLLFIGYHIRLSVSEEKEEREKSENKNRKREEIKKLKARKHAGRFILAKKKEGDALTGIPSAVRPSYIEKHEVFAWAIQEGFNDETKGMIWEELKAQKITLIQVGFHIYGE